MRRVWLLGALLCAGCANIEGPVEHYRNYRRPDVPSLPISEQEKRGREQLAIPEYKPNVAPGNDIQFPGLYYGR
jgi:hypothetical protein